jgi:hypothetical protein
LRFALEQRGRRDDATTARGAFGADTKKHKEHQEHQGNKPTISVPPLAAKRGAANG